ncbi:MAG TPA: XRE family transcriptional regulator [Gemmataceae bacterium]|nr:XRE family transcriptional regulator [Gemmataceae bacterium]
MTPLSELAARLRKTFPDARLDFSEPAVPGGVGFLDISHSGDVLAVQWQEKWHFGVSSPEGHGYGEKPDEVYRTVDEVAARITDLLDSRRKTEPPLAVTLRELRAERRLPQTELAALLGVSQPAVSRLERHVSRMLVASLRAVVQAMGGRLVIQAHFPDGVVRQIAIDEEAAPKPEPERVMIDG